MITIAVEIALSFISPLEPTRKPDHQYDYRGKNEKSDSERRQRVGEQIGWAGQPSK
jgi:hypothetical protein